MKKLATFSVVLCLIVGSVTLLGVAQEKPNAAANDRVRIGVFDSRALAAAYAASEPFNRQVRGLMEERKKAQAAGDVKRVKELEAQGEKQQDLFHKQGFGKWPVDNILDAVRPKLPDVAKTAGVDVLISKWDIAYQAPGAELVDVTDAMVQLFNPNERTLKIVKELRSQSPRPIAEIEKMSANE